MMRAVQTIQNPKPVPVRIISGGQTGADRAGLDWAIAHGVAHGGWCPKGRLAADGPLHPRYLLNETESTGYRQRTKRNVADADASLILNTGPLDGGTLQTLRFAQTLHKPHLLLQLDGPDSPNADALTLCEWLLRVQPISLNIAGPREEKRPGIYALSLALLTQAFGHAQG
jgi:hypothetical protein